MKDLLSPIGICEKLGYKDYRSIYSQMYRDKLGEPNVTIKIDGADCKFWDLSNSEIYSYPEEELYTNDGAANYMDVSRTTVRYGMIFDGRLSNPLVIRINNKEKKFWKKSQLDIAKTQVRKKNKKRSQ